MLSIGEMSRRTGVKVPTIRYYELTGLLAAPDRTDGNQRRYEPAALERLHFIRHCRDLGFALEAVRDLLDLGQDPDQPCHEADAIARAHLADVRARIARLQRLEAELQRISTACAHGAVGDCAVIQSLSDHDLCETEHWV
ncbi:MAG: MerR family transcriptional regulator [Minwuia sp.]|uniref:MerR family transcriptional regulator n=1 Tax=Minwuia sp. TaxID=2493630 RepID=UPI003A8BC391